MSEFFSPKNFLAERLSENKITSVINTCISFYFLLIFSADKTEVLENRSKKDEQEIA